MDLFTLTGLTVSSAMGSSPRYDVFAGVTDPAGGPVGTLALSDISLDGRVRRWFGNPAEYPFSLTLSDPAGGTVLTVDKEREGTFGCYFEVTVRLADGREIGRVRQRWPLSGELTFHEGSGAEIATAPIGRLSAGYTVRGTSEWATVEPDLGEPRRYLLRFADDAPVLVRALTLAHVGAADATLFPSGRAF